jgi:signal transduction histidine kinase
MFSTHREGSGLGLSIVKRIVESHHGSIDVASSPAGTKFEIRIGAATESSRAQNNRNMEVVCEPVTCSR